MLHRSCAGRHAGAAAVASDERDPDYPVEAPPSQLWDKERERGQFPLPFVSHLFRPEVTTGPLVPPEAKKIPGAFSFREPNRILKLDWSEFVQLNSSYSDYK